MTTPHGNYCVRVIVGEMLFSDDLLVNQHLLVDCFTDQNIIYEMTVLLRASRQILSLVSALLPGLPQVPLTLNCILTLRPISLG
jgi:hypothetical protein